MEEKQFWTEWQQTLLEFKLLSTTTLV